MKGWFCLALLMMSLGCQSGTSRASTSATAPVRTSLLYAIADHEPALVLLRMIAAGADVNETDGRNTALYYAVGLSYDDESMLPVIKAMVEHGADIKARCIGGFSALHHACEDESLEVVDYLIAKGADVNAKDDTGITPLHVAASPRFGGRSIANHRAIIVVLVAHGANVNAISLDGTTPRDLALEGDKRLDALIGALGGSYGFSDRLRQKAPTTKPRLSPLRG